MAAVLRAIPSQVPTLDELGLPEIVTRFSGLSKGLVLVTGPTGSGKSTTLAAMIDWINSTQPSHVLTIEDPIEFIHQSKTALINQREIGHSCLNFADGLKYALREDPDVILIGELRDLETMALALTAAETGHLVLATLHTRGAAASIDRIIDSFAANQQSMIRTMLAESLAGVVSQTLLKRADGKGRVGAYEIMVVNHAISNLIREGKVFQIESVMQTARKEGMVLLPQSVKSLLDRGLVTKEEANPYLIEQTAATAVQAVSIAPAVVPKPEPKPVQPFQELADGILDLTDDSLDLIRQDLDDVEAELEIPKPAIQAPPPVPPPLKKKTR